MASRAKVRTVMEVGSDGVAVITLINPPVNSLSFDGTIFSDLHDSEFHWIYIIRFRSFLVFDCFAQFLSRSVFWLLLSP